MLTCYDGARNIGCHTDPVKEPFFWGMGVGTLLWHGGGFFLLALALRELPALYAVTIYEVRGCLLDIHPRPPRTPSPNAHLPRDSTISSHPSVPTSQGTLIITGAMSGALVLMELADQPTFYLALYSLSMMLILGGLGILARRARGSAVQIRTRHTPDTLSRRRLQTNPYRPHSYLPALLPYAALPGGRSRSYAAQRPIVPPRVYDVLGTRGALRARSVWRWRESNRPQVRPNRQHRDLNMWAIRVPL